MLHHWHHQRHFGFLVAVRVCMILIFVWVSVGGVLGEMLLLSCAASEIQKTIADNESQ